jgi:CheY-like chemotaxis protein/anti-sigma regulatory factor (Ser/Thr protein kinase)
MAKILVVEDDPQVREVVCAIVEMDGHQVVSAHDGKDAADRIETDAFDVIVSDVWMPRMNGMELLGHVQAQNVPSRFIIMTGDNTPETVLDAVRKQAYGYLRKPFEPKQLLVLLRSALEAPPALAPIEVISSRPEWVELVVPCSLEAADRIGAFMDQLKTDVPGEIREAVGKVFRELLLNAIEWGGHLDPERKVRVACLRTPRMLLYRIADPGGGFKFENLSHAAVNNPPDQPAEHLRVRAEKGIRPGGFGIFLARQLVDELIYNEAQNEVVFIKYLNNKPY